MLYAHHNCATIKTCAQISVISYFVSYITTAIYGLICCAKGRNHMQYLQLYCMYVCIHIQYLHPFTCIHGIRRAFAYKYVNMSLCLDCRTWTSTWRTSASVQSSLPCASGRRWRRATWRLRTEAAGGRFVMRSGHRWTAASFVACLDSLGRRNTTPECTSECWARLDCEEYWIMAMGQAQNWESFYGFGMHERITWNTLNS